MIQNSETLSYSSTHEGSFRVHFLSFVVYCTGTVWRTSQLYQHVQRVSACRGAGSCPNFIFFHLSRIGSWFIANLASNHLLFMQVSARLPKSSVLLELVCDPPFSFISARLDIFLSSLRQTYAGGFTLLVFFLQGSGGFHRGGIPFL